MLWNKLPKNVIYAKDITLLSQKWINVQQFEKTAKAC